MRTARPSGLTRLRAGAAPFAKSALLRLGGYAALRRVAPSRQLAILRYHAICGPEGEAYADPQICVSPEALEAHVRYLTSRYAVIRLDEAVARLRARRPLPRNAVALTFDDGYADNLGAARVLAQYGASATFYITAGCLAGEQPFWPAELRSLVRGIAEPAIALRLGSERLRLDFGSEKARHAAVRSLTKTFKSHPIPVRESLREQLRAVSRATESPRIMLTWDEVREMHQLGMTIGSHTMTHPNLPSAGLAAAEQELRASKARLEHEIDAPVSMFSYPNGGAERYLTPEVQRAVRETGYLAATTSKNAFAGEASDLYALERVEVEERVEDLVFALEVERFAFRPES